MEERVARGLQLRALLRGRLPDSVEDWPGDVLAEWRERAAIMEFCGGLSRCDAEARAERLMRAVLGQSSSRGPSSRH